MNIFSVWFSFSSFFHNVLGSSCGIDNSPVSHVHEGLTHIEMYPWLGILYYPYNNKRYTTAVVLVTRQIVLATAVEIDKMPKTDFRSRARVVIGHNCSSPGVGIRDYNYHPDYSRDTYSALAIIQLETDYVTIELRPICSPPSYFNNQYFYAMVLSESCSRATVMIYKMEYVSREQCQDFYRRSGLDLATMWPSYTACARSTTGGQCVWRSGAILAVKTGFRWRLLGFGVYGPGCQMPARFLDYGMYHSWVQRSIDKIGRPTISPLGQNHIVFRRSLSNVQRYGSCDPEERKHKLYSDHIKIITLKDHIISYNVTIYEKIEYACVIFKADSAYGHTSTEAIKPKLRLRNWCDNYHLKDTNCYNLANVEISFHVQINFDMPVSFRVMAYGRKTSDIDYKEILRSEFEKTLPPTILTYEEMRNDVNFTLLYRHNNWFHRKLLIKPITTTTKPTPKTTKPTSTKTNPLPMTTKPTPRITNPPMTTKPTPKKTNPPLMTTTPTPRKTNPPPMTTKPTSKKTSPPPLTTKPTPRKTNPPPMTTKPTPRKTNPPPMTTKPTPKKTKPPPLTIKPTPRKTNPPPMTTKPTPKKTNPPPLTTKPTPRKTNPPPMTTKPTPKKTNPPPLTTKPTPRKTNPPPMTTKPTPKKTNPPPTTVKPTPKKTNPPPMTTKPTPMTTTPTPKKTNPPPMTTTPTPRKTNPPPLTTKPTPMTTKPTPKKTNPPPTTTKPTPKKTNPPLTTIPTPMTTTPIPMTTTPIPMTTEPTPMTTKPPSSYLCHYLGIYCK